jgi:hypothetical protein
VPARPAAAIHHPSSKSYSQHPRKPQHQNKFLCLDAAPKKRAINKKENDAKGGEKE